MSKIKRWMRAFTGLLLALGIIGAIILMMITLFTGCALAPEPHREYDEETMEWMVAYLDILERAADAGRGRTNHGPAGTVFELAEKRIHEGAVSEQEVRQADEAATTIRGFWKELKALGPPPDEDLSRNYEFMLDSYDYWGTAVTALRYFVETGESEWLTRAEKDMGMSVHLSELAGESLPPRPSYYIAP